MFNLQERMECDCCSPWLYCTIEGVCWNNELGLGLETHGTWMYVEQETVRTQCGPGLPAWLP